MTNYSVRLVKKEDLQIILSWRNDENIRRHMIYQHEISISEHLDWFERESRNPDKRILIFQENNVPHGFVQFSGLENQKGVIDWGFYTAPLTAKGTGKRLGLAALNHIFLDTKVKKVRGWVLNSNERSKKYHLQLNFIEDCEERSLRKSEVKDGDSELICFSLSRERWDK